MAPQGTNNGSGAQAGQAGLAPGSVQSGQQQPGNTFNSVGAQAQAGTLGSTTANSFLGASPTTVEAPPSAAQSAYEYQQYVAGAKVTIGPQLATMLGLPANTPQTGDAIMQAFQNLPHDELVQLEAWLWQAGYYQNVEGVASTTRPNLGALDISAFAAMSQAILQSSDYNTTLSQLIASGVAAKVGKTAEESQLPPATGGGQTYQITLPNPQDIYQQAYSTFESALGRAPTQAEIDALTQTVDKQTQLYQQSLNQQQEAMSQTKYQTQLQQRQAGLNPAVTPNVPVQVQAVQQTQAQQAQQQGKAMVGERTVGGGNPTSVNPPQPQAQQQQQSPAVQQYLAALNQAKQNGLSPEQQAQANQVMQQAAQNPQVAAYLQQQSMAAQSQMSAPGDVYIPGNTITTQQAPTVQGAAFTQATTGANAVPYLGYQYLQAFQAIANMIKAGAPTG